MFVSVALMTLSVVASGAEGEWPDARTDANH